MTEGTSTLFQDDPPRCEGCELAAARMAYDAGLGASEWEAFIDRVPVCDDCRKVAVVLGRAT